MIIPPNDATTLHAAIPGSVTDGQGNWAIPCSTTTTVALVFAGKSFAIDRRDIIGPQLTRNSGLCASNIAGQQVGGPNQWLVGDVFLKNVIPPISFLLI